jgi:sugar phosphate isomerase/epimerase
MKTAEDIAWAQRASDEARERGIRLAHQCHTASLFETVDGSLEVLRAVGRPNFGLIYEPANLELCGQPYGPEVIARFAPYLFNAYLQNQLLTPDGRAGLETWPRGPVRYDPIPLHAPRGIDFPAVFAGLTHIGYHGYVTVHQALAEIMAPPEAARVSAEYLRTLATFDIASAR